MYRLEYGTTLIEYSVIFSPRTTLAIDIHPNLQVIVKAPEGTKLTEIEAKVKKTRPVDFTSAETV